MIHNHDLGTHLIATEKSTGTLTERCRGVSPPVHRERKAEDHRGRSDLIGQTEKSMAKLLKPREEVKKAIVARIRTGKDLTAKAEIAESTGGYEDWLFIFAKWRDETADELTTLYEERDIGREFTAVTVTGEHSSRASLFHIGRMHSN